MSAAPTALGSIITSLPQPFRVGLTFGAGPPGLYDSVVVDVPAPIDRNANQIGEIGISYCGSPARAGTRRSPGADSLLFSYHLVIPGFQAPGV